MIIDPSVIENGVTPAILDKLINRHEDKKSRYEKLMRYYKGKHYIETRPKRSADAANTRVVCNHAKHITDMVTAYLVGNPVTYTASEGVDIEPLKDVYFEQDISAVDSEIVKSMSIYGRAYELLYRESDAQPRSVVLAPGNVFVAYDNTARQMPLFAVHYYKRFDLDGNVMGIVCCVYDKDEIVCYTGRADNWAGMTEESREAHYFDGIPIIEYRNNNEYQGDFEQVIPLIDAYNELQSDRVDDKADFVDAFLFLRGIEIDSEQAQALKRERVLIGYDKEAAAEYLSKVLSERDVKVLRDDLKEDIHRFSCVPDLTDESFGNNLSGVAIKYKLIGFEQHIKNKERHLTKGLRERFRLYAAFLALKSKMRAVSASDVDIVFKRNLPVNELEAAQMISYLNGMVSTETLLEQLDFVSDAKEEKKLLDKEKVQNYADRMRAVEGISKGVGYDGGSFGKY